MRNAKIFLLAALLILYGTHTQAAATVPTEIMGLEAQKEGPEPAPAAEAVHKEGGLDYWFAQILPNFFKINPNKITEKNIFLVPNLKSESDEPSALEKNGLYASIKHNATPEAKNTAGLNPVVTAFRAYARSEHAHNFVTLPENLQGDEAQQIEARSALLAAIQEAFFKLELFNILLETKLDLLRLYWIRYNIVDTLLANIDKINSQKFINETFSNSVRDVFYAPNVKFIYDVWVNVKIDMILNWVNAWNKIEESKFERVGEKPAWAKWVGKDTRHYKEVLQHAYLSPKLALIAKFAFIKEENTIETSNAWIFEREPLLSNLTNKDTTSNFLNFLNNLPGKADWYSKHRYTIALYLEQLFVYEKFKDFSDDKETLSKLITTQQIKIFKPSLSSIFALLGEADDLPNPADNPIQTKLRDRIAEMLGVVTPPE